MVMHVHYQENVQILKIHLFKQENIHDLCNLYVPSKSKLLYLEIASTEQVEQLSPHFLEPFVLLFFHTEETGIERKKEGVDTYQKPVMYQMFVIKSKTQFD